MMTAAELREWRLGHDLSQADVAQLLDRGLRQIVKYEAGEAVIPVVVELALEALDWRLSDRG